MKTPEFQSVREVAQELDVRVWLFGGTASSFVHYAKAVLLNQKGLKELQSDRLNWDFTDIFRSTQDLDIVVDGSREKINQLQQVLLEKYPFFLGSKTGWEVRSLKDPSGTPGKFDYKEALLDDINFTHQNTDSHSLAMVEVTQSKDPVIRDLKHWDLPYSQFLPDAIKGEITYYRNPRHFETGRARRGENPEIVSVVRILIKAFQYDLKISQEAREQIQEIIHKFDPSSLTDVAARQFEKIVKKLVMHAVNIEYALKELDALNLRKKLIDMGDKDKYNSSSWWVNKEALKSFEVGRKNGATAKELEIDIVAHETNDFLSYESITRAHSGQPNVLISRNGFSGETVSRSGDGFYTQMGREGARGTGLTIRFKVNPEAREGTDFTKDGEYIIFHNKNALEVIPESLNFSAEMLFEIIKNPEKFNIDHSDKALWEKFLRKVDADYMKTDLLRFFKSSNLTPLENLELIDKFFSSSMPEKLKQSLMVFVYESDFIIPKDLRLNLLSRHVENIPKTAKGEKLLLKELRDKNQNSLEKLELVDKAFSSSMPEKLKQSLMVFVYENDFIIPKGSRLSLLFKYLKYIPITAKGKKILLREIGSPTESLEFVNHFFRPPIFSTPEKLRGSLLIFIYENDSIIPKNSRLSLLSRHIEDILLTTKGEYFLLKELRDKNQNPLEKLELVNKVLSSSMPEKLKQSLFFFVYENDFIIPKDSRLSLLSKYLHYIPTTAKGESFC